MGTNITYDHRELTTFAASVLEKIGAPKADAELVADCLIKADLRGVASHGISRLPIYAKRLAVGVVNSKPNIRVLKELAGTALIDGDNGMGPVIGHKAMALCIEKAKGAGVGFCAVRNGNHFGIAAYYTLQALRQGMIGIAISNAPPSIAPWGGVDPKFGTNPLSIAVPAGSHPPLVLDMAVSVVARGKIILAAKQGLPIPEGWAITKDGRPTTDANEAMEGTSLPFGGPKGYGIGLVNDILSGVLSGAFYGPLLNSLWGNFEDPQNVGFFMGAINIEAFMDPKEFGERIDSYFAQVKAGRKAPGVEEILIPGELELRAEQKNVQGGIEVPGAVVEELKQVAETYGIAFPNGK
ncbi:MAG: Ldh family oxidoreductase [Limnochordia bacterium]